MGLSVTLIRNKLCRSKVRGKYIGWIPLGPSVTFEVIKEIKKYFLLRNFKCFTNFATVPTLSNLAKFLANFLLTLEVFTPS